MITVQYSRFSCVHERCVDWLHASVAVRLRSDVINVTRDMVGQTSARYAAASGRLCMPVIISRAYISVSIVSPLGAPTVVSRDALHTASCIAISQLRQQINIYD